jgi:hypothetical protein
MSTYGDAQCRKLEPGNLITGGAVCDLWYKDDNVTVPQDPPKEPTNVPWENENRNTGNTGNTGNCNDCSYSFMENDKPHCMMTGGIIDKIKRCKHYSSVDDVVIEQDEGWGESYSTTLELPDVSDIIEEPVEQEEPEHGYCETCAFAYYNNDIPWCRKHDQEIHADDWCYDYAKEGSIVILEDE